MKDLTKTTIISELLNSLKQIKTHWIMLIIASLIDMAFFIAWGFFTTPIKNNILKQSILLANNLSTAMAEKPIGLLNHLISPQIRPQTTNMILLLGILFLTIYVIYTVFEGVNWWIITKIAGHKTKFRKYFLTFAKINLLWISGLILYQALDLIFNMRFIAIKQVLPNALNVPAIVFLILFILLIIAAIFSYPTLKIKTLFKTPLKTTIPLVIISTSIFLTTQFVLDKIGKLDVATALVIGIVLLFPVITFIKVYITKALTNVHTRN